MTLKAALSEADVAYIRGNFVSFDYACTRAGLDPAQVRQNVDQGRLPKPSYVLDDGTEMVPNDYFVLLDDAGHPDALESHFRQRYAAAAKTRGEAPSAEELDEEWKGYLSGEYGVCLANVTPETIFRKGRLVAKIEALTADARPDDPAWREELAASVDELDRLERPFAEYDRVRFGGPVSRDRLITAVRERYLAS